MAVAQLERLFKGEQIIGVDDGWHPLTHDCVRHRMHSYLCGVRYLFDTDNYVHGGFLLPPSMGGGLVSTHACVHHSCQPFGVLYHIEMASIPTLLAYD
ncbi:hypothetical protein RHECNPAF_690012 [Rhizobium etli CNPAF512]|nr:hypothetical protein RHECNPAF_690012 [Rhizobium etli CNPAF512]